MKNLFFLMLVGFMMTGCFAPVNSVYDSAELLEVGEIQVKGNYSKYQQFGEHGEQEVLNQNFGASLALGITENLAIGIRYEEMTIKNYYGDLDFEEGDSKLKYAEFRTKTALLKNKISYELAIGNYQQEKNMLAISADNRIYFTEKFNKNIELTAVPKFNFMLSSNPFQFINPGVIVSAGLSTDLDKWAIRPEVGYDGHLNIGVGMNYNFQL